MGRTRRKKAFSERIARNENGIRELKRKNQELEKKIRKLEMKNKELDERLKPIEETFDIMGGLD